MSTISTGTPLSLCHRVLVRVLRSVTNVLAASAGLIVFVVFPYVLLEHWHMLPNWEAMNFIFILFPIVIAWMHAGLYMTLIVAACETIVLKLSPSARRARIEASAKIVICGLVYVLLYLGNRFNFH